MSGDLLSLLLGIAVRSTAILVVALLATRLLARRSAALRHAVLAASVVGVIVVPAVTMLAPDVRAPFVANVVSSGLEWLQRPIRSLRGEPVVRRTGQGLVDASPVDEIGLESSNDSSTGSRGVIVLIMMWAVGALAVGGRTVVRSIRAARLTARARPVDDRSVRAIAIDVARRQHQAAPARILETPELHAPATVGILRPTVLLPVSRSWTPEYTRYVLAHELAHATRHDCLTQTLSQIACALHWFNPLMWRVDRRMALERERACDDLALAEGAPPDGYAMLLLDVARRTAERALPPAAILTMAQPSELETRLLAILDPARDRGVVSRRTGRVLATIAVITVTFSGTLRLEAAPTVPNAYVAEVQEPLPRQSRVEPDTRNDSVADPASERIARANLDVARRRGRIALRGPDSALARVLLLALEREPRSREDLVRERAAWALSQTRGGRLMERLIEALNDKDWRVRAYAAWSVAPAHDPRSVPPLIGLMTDPVWRMRAMAAHALAQIGDARARSVMTAAVRDEAWQVRVSGVRYLGRFSDAEARGHLRAALRDSHVLVRNTASRALGVQSP